MLSTRLRLGTSLSLQNIPLEVFFHIFALLEAEEDKTTISACVLVSRLWHDMALPSLWTRIILRPTQSLYKFRRMMEGKPLLAQSIRSLTLRDPLYELYTDQPPDPESLEPASIPFSVAVLRDIMAILPKLQHISLQGITLYEAPTETPLPLLRSGTRANGLELMDVSFHESTPITTYTFLQCFLPSSSIEELTLTSSDCTPIPESEVQSPHHKPLSVRNLNLVGVLGKAQLAQHYTTLSQCLLPGCLRSLATSATSNDDLALLHAFLRASDSDTAGGLADLELDLSEAEVDACYLSDTLASLSCLTTLRLHVPYISLTREGGLSLAEVFSLHASRTLEQVHLNMHWSRPAYLDLDYHDELEEAEDVDGTFTEATDDARVPDPDAYEDQLPELDTILSRASGFPAMGQVALTITVDSSFTRSDGEIIAEHFSAEVFPKMCRAGRFTIQFAPQRDLHPPSRHIK